MNSNCCKYGAFEGCSHLTFILGVSPILPSDLSCMFFGCSAFNGDLSQWDTPRLFICVGCFVGALCLTEIFPSGILPELCI